MKMNEVLDKVKLALEQRLTDQELAEKCPTLTPEDIHTIRQTMDDLQVLPFAAIEELSQVGESYEKKMILSSPIQSREYELFIQRFKESFLSFKTYQEEHFKSDDSRMDDLIFASLVEQLQQECFKNDELMLTYFQQYQEQLENI